MPPVIAAVGALLAVEIAFGVTIGAILVSTVIGTALSFGVNAIFGQGSLSTNFDARGKTITVREPANARRVIYGTSQVGGTVIYADQADASDHTLLFGVALAGHECEAIDKVYFGDTEVSLGAADGDGTQTSNASRFAPDLFKVAKFLGSSTQTAYAPWVSATTRWTSAHRLRGITWLAFTLEFDQDAYPTGLQNISALVRGKKLFDVRDSTTAFSDNPALCLYDYLTNTTYGMGVPTSRIDTATFQAAANVCDETVSLAGGGTEKRYTCNGNFTMDIKPRDVLRALLSSCAGDLVYSGGVWKLYAGAAKTATVTITDSDLRGGVQVSAGTTREQSFNGVKGLYQGPKTQYQPDDYPAVESSTFLSEDGGIKRFDELNLPFTDTPSMSQRIAKIHLLRNRQTITARVPLKLTGFRIETHDWIKVTNTRMGWNEKLFEVKNWRLTSAEGQGGTPAMGVDLDLREVASNVFDFSTSEETEVDPAPNTNLPQPWVVAAPQAPLTITGSTETLPDGSTLGVLTVSWTASPTGNLKFYEIQIKKSTDSNFEPSRLVPATQTTVVIRSVVPGVTYDVRVRAINVVDARSDWLQSNQALNADQTAPALPTGISVTGDFKSLNLEFTAPSDDDTAAVRIHVRTTNTTPTDDTFLFGTVAVSPGQKVKLKIIDLTGSTTYFVWLQSVDRTGNVSGFTTAVSAATRLLLADEITDGILNTAKFAQDIEPVELVDTVPNPVGYTGPRNIFDKTNRKLLIYDDSVPEFVDAGILNLDEMGGQLVVGQIAAGAVGATEIAAQAINADKLAAGSVTAANAAIADAAVVEAKIAAAAITEAKIGSAAVQTLKIAGNAVTVGGSVLGSNTTNIVSGQLLAQINFDPGISGTDVTMIFTCGMTVPDSVRNLSVRFQEAGVTKATRSAGAGAAFGTGTVNYAGAAQHSFASTRSTNTTYRVEIASGNVTGVVTPVLTLIIRKR